MVILFLCDRKACSNCSYPVCKHTKDPTHAVNFKSSCGAFWEKAVETDAETPGECADLQSGE